MLGSIKPGQPWVWGAKGKHPIAKDYVAIGNQSPLFQAFANWVDSGYAKTEPNRFKQYSWRFWARGLKKGELVCGLLRDSHDSYGRPYPFLVMGTGNLAGWEEKWEMLPYALEEIWSGLEYFSTRKAVDYSALERELQRMAHPVMKEHPDIPQELLSQAIAHVQKTNPGQRAELAVSIDSPASADPADTIALWHLSLKASVAWFPNAVFVGGTPQETILAAYQRSLIAEDFVQLWSMDKT